MDGPLWVKIRAGIALSEVIKSGDRHLSSPTIYLGIQDIAEPEEWAGALVRSGVHAWVYLGEDPLWRFKTERALGGEVPRVSLHNDMDEVSRRLRTTFVDWVGELSRVNGSLEWWSSALAEKNAFSKLYPQICRLIIGKHFINSVSIDSLAIICSSELVFDELMSTSVSLGVGSTPIIPRRGVVQSLKRIINDNLRTIYHNANQMLGKERTLEIGMRWCNEMEFRRKVIGNNIASESFSGDDTVLLITWVDERNFATDGSYRDPHFGNLPALLREHGFRVAYVPRVLDSMPFENAVRRLMDTDERIFFPEQFLSKQMVEQCRIRAETFSPLIPEESKIDGMRIGALAREFHETNKHRLAWNLSQKEMIAGMSSIGVRPAFAMYTCEGHAWEQALVSGIRAHMPETEIVGVDSGSFTPMLLSMFPAVSEIGDRPLPDRIVTAGSLGRDILVRNGLPSELVRAGCASRFLELGEQYHMSSVRSHKQNNRPATVLIATSIDFNDSLELTSTVLKALGGSLEYKLVLKFHPAVDRFELIKSLGELATGDNVNVEIRSIEELLVEADVMMYSLTKVCFDALQFSVPPVFVQSESGLNLDQLEAVPEARWSVSSVEEVRRVVSEIIDLAPEAKMEWAHRAQSILPMAYAPVTQECVEAFVGQQ